MAYPSSYGDWQQWIAHEFFSTNDAVLLFIDEDDLDRRLPDLGKAIDNLAGAVRERVNLGAGPRMFESLEHAVTRWSDGERVAPPPVLPVLLVSTIAAGRMQNGEDVRASNYYMPLAHVLAQGLNLADPKPLRDTLRNGAFAVVASWWKTLDQWIRAGNGSRGISLIEGDDRLSRIGYPLSQAIVRNSDRVALTYFFDRVVDAEGDVPPVDRLLMLLQLWVRRREDLSPVFRNFARMAPGQGADSAADGVRQLLGETVRTLAQSWDRVIRTPEGRPRLRLRLAIDEEQWSAEWIPFALNGPDPLELLVGDTLQTWRHDVVSGFYTGGSLPLDDGDSVREGLALTAGQNRLIHSRAELLLFRMDRFLGTWVSVESLVPFERHLLAVATDRLASLSAALDLAGVPYIKVRQQSADRLLPGFAILQDIEIRDTAQWDEATESLDIRGSDALTIEFVGRPRLVHGLQVLTDLAPRIYLAGGEPDLLVPAGSTERTVVAELDGSISELPGRDIPIELGRFVESAGQHVLQVESSDLGFSTVEIERLEFEDLGAAQQIGWDASGAVASGDSVAVRGATVRNDAPLRVAQFRRRRERNCFLMADGEVREVAEPGPPAFLAELEIPGAGLFEILSPKAARWQASRLGARWSVRSLTEGDLEFRSELDIPHYWKEASRTELARQLWEAVSGRVPK